MSQENNTYATVYSEKMMKTENRGVFGFSLFTDFQVVTFNKESCGKAIFRYQLGNEKVTLLSGHLISP